MFSIISAIIHKELYNVINEGTNFISKCYGIKSSSSMSNTRLIAWGRKNGKGHTSSPILARLPPSTEASVENLKRVHFQAVLRRTLNEKCPLKLNPEEFGWKRDTLNKILVPVHLPENVKLGPDYILQMIRCGCKSNIPCNQGQL